MLVPFSPPAFRTYPTTVLFDDLFYDGKAQPAASRFGISGRFRPVKAIKNLFQRLFFNPRTIVPDAYRRLPFSLGQFHPKVPLRLIHVFETVVDDIHDHPPQFLAIRLDIDRPPESGKPYRNPLHPRIEAQLLRAVPQKSRQVHRFPVKGHPSQIESGKQQQFIDQTLHVFRLLRDHVPIFSRIGPVSAMPSRIPSMHALMPVSGVCRSWDIWVNNCLRFSSYCNWIRIDSLSRRRIASKAIPSSPISSLRC